MSAVSEQTQRPDQPPATERLRTRMMALGLAERLVAAIDAVRRQDFVPPHLWRLAHADPGLWLPGGAVLPAPEAVARLLAALDPQPEERVVEIGTGTGYVTALLARLCREVVTVDDADRTAGALTTTAGAVHRLIGPGAAAWAALPEGPCDAILLQQPCDAPPLALLARAPRVVCVVGPAAGPQRLLLLRRNDERPGAATILDQGPILLPMPDVVRTALGDGPAPAMTAAGVEGDPAVPGMEGGDAPPQDA